MDSKMFEKNGNSFFVATATIINLCLCPIISVKNYFNNQSESLHGAAKPTSLLQTYGSLYSRFGSWHFWKSTIVPVAVAGTVSQVSSLHLYRLIYDKMKTREEESRNMDTYVMMMTTLFSASCASVVATTASFPLRNVTKISALSLSPCSTSFTTWLRHSSLSVPRLAIPVVIYDTFARPSNLFSEHYKPDNHTYLAPNSWFRAHLGVAFISTFVGSAVSACGEMILRKRAMNEFLVTFRRESSRNVGFSLVMLAYHFSLKLSTSD